MIRDIRALLFATLALGGLLPACSQPCDTDHICALDTNNNVCDGTHFVPCDDSSRSERISCVRTQKTAVCTPTGWTFQNASQ